MINLIIALVAAAAAWGLSLLVLDSVWAGLLPFFLVLFGLYLYLARQTNRALEAIATRAQKQMGNLQTVKSAKQRAEIIERAIGTLKEGFALGKRQFLISGQLHAQIGQLYFVQKKFKEAKPHLEQAFFKAWTAIAMLACIHFKKKNYGEMREAFEKGVKHNKKESLLWNLYAWCLWKSGEAEDAQKVLSRGLDATDNDERIKANLDALRNKKKMKMRGWKEQWYQFHLEAPPQPKMRVDRRSMYRGR